MSENETERTMDNEKKAAKWKARISACRRKRDELKRVWEKNVAYRRNKPFEGESNEDRVAVPIDHAYTKKKVSSLFSQVPQVRLTPKNKKYAAAVPVFARELNEVLKEQVKLEVLLREVLVDVVNAAGIGAVMCGYTATFEDVQVPAVDLSTLPPEIAMQMMQSGQIPMTTVKRPVSELFYGKRISPAALIWDSSFKGSDFDDSNFVGYDGALTWAQSLREFGASEERPNGLKPEHKEQVCGSGSEAPSLDDASESEQGAERLVRFTRVFYRTAAFNPDEKYLDRISEIVFIEGLDEPVVDEPLRWQRFDEESGQYVGVCKFPIRILTVDYFADECIPASNSEMGRPQVDELNKTRAQILAQRESSIPVRTFNTNRVDPLVAANLQRGEWNGMIPVNGNPNDAFSEVARPAFPRESFEFDRVAKSDLQDAWSLGDNQVGAFASGERSASEAQIVQSNFSQLVGIERGDVAKFIAGIAEVIAGLMQLYYDRPNEEPLVGEEGVQRIDQVWDRSKVQGARFVFEINPDSMVALDANQKIDRLMKFLNLTGKSGFVNVESIIAEIAQLSGLDPAEVMTKPQPKAPEEPNISLRLSGVEDLMNPLAVALLMKSGQAPSPDELQAAKELVANVMSPAQPQVTSAPAPQGLLPAGPPNEDWAAFPRVTKRVAELGG